jgi:SAM-dependent methyltransferase
MRFGIRTRAGALVREIRLRTTPKGTEPEIVVHDGGQSTTVDEYWNRHTVHSEPFLTGRESESYLRKRNSEYPMFTQLMDLYGDHTGEVVLDYGCGTGDDVTGFLLWSNARKVVGMDVSDKALSLLRHRLALHRVDTARVDLVKINDSSAVIPLPDESVDWIHSGGVLHHTSHPQEILREFRRVMKAGVEGRLMVYNPQSVFYHLWIAYAQMIVNDAFPGLTIDEAFTRSTDGPDCPVSEAWPPDRVLEMITAAGLQGTFRGGYVNVQEIEFLNQYKARAVADQRLGDAHRRFLQELQLDPRGYPMWRGKYAGVGGVFTFRKPHSGASDAS